MNPSETLEPDAAARAYHAQLAEMGYMLVTPMPGGRWAAVFPFLFTWAVIEGADADPCGYSGRWCYASFEKAVDGLNAWLLSGFAGEPGGWHRHPDSGRRRPEGDPAREFIER